MKGKKEAIKNVENDKKEDKQKEALHKMTHLAHLKLTSEEENLFAQELDFILKQFQKIDASVEKDLPIMVHSLGRDVYNTMDTTNAMKTINAIEKKEKEAWKLREDKVQGEMKVEEALKNAPEVQDNFFKVPPVRK